MIDYPAIVIPVHSVVDPALDHADKEYNPANSKDAEIQAQCKLRPQPGLEDFYLACFYWLWKSDVPEEYAGAPISVQLVCRRFREEESIGLAGVIADALRTKWAYENHEEGGTYFDGVVILEFSIITKQWLCTGKCFHRTGKRAFNKSDVNMIFDWPLSDYLWGWNLRSQLQILGLPLARRNS